MNEAAEIVEDALDADGELGLTAEELRLLEGMTFKQNGTIEHPELGDVTLDVVAEIERHKRATRVNAAEARLAIGKWNRAIEHKPTRFGQIVASIDEDDFIEQERLEPGCWRDRGFRKDFLKALPECKVVARSRKAQVIKPEGPVKAEGLRLKDEGAARCL